MSRRIEVTSAEVAAAQLQLVVDAKLGQSTSEVVRKIAEAKPAHDDEDAELSRPA